MARLQGEVRRLQGERLSLLLAVDEPPPPAHPPQDPAAPADGAGLAAARRRAAVRNDLKRCYRCAAAAPPRRTAPLSHAGRTGEEQLLLRANMGYAARYRRAQSKERNRTRCSKSVIKERARKVRSATARSRRATLLECPLAVAAHVRGDVAQDKERIRRGGMVLAARRADGAAPSAPRACGRSTAGADAHALALG